MRPLVRCAIYTRVSTEHGLEQEFNSLENQREAAEAYVKSQAHEGWRLLPARYDDGGFSGGSIERPALQKLLAEIRARRVDVVVVYKVDRLTRSLADFAKLVELFDAHVVSFVSVTQAFNTTTSMGRLTLNVLLSFAQFEREVTGERIRDKIAASKRKGIWMGGVVPLGYRVESRALHVVEAHAEIVRCLFARYLELGTVSRLKAWLDHARITIPERRDGAGRPTGGKPFSRGHLYRLLANPIYVGRLAHKDQVHEGQHPAIVDEAIFAAVQELLAAKARRAAGSPLAGSHLLKGRIRDSDGTVLTPSHTRKGQHRYRYYVSRNLLRGERASSVRGLPAAEIEAKVVQALRSTHTDSSELDPPSLIERHLARLVVHPDRLEIRLTDDREPVIVPWTNTSFTRQREIVVPPERAGGTHRPMKAEDRARILKAIATGRAWMSELIEARIAGPAAIASRERLSERSVQMTLSLAQLAPSVVRAIVEGRLPRGIGVRNLSELSPVWTEQERALGIS
ncbi:MAG: recombinase family protein [Methylobacteriaceae bacterium]|nr:recombinase family protein [Methylobacteriaceae bacterium]